MEGVWFATNYYESLSDIYIKYGFLDWKEDVVTDLIDDESILFLSRKKYGNKDLQYFSYDLKHDKGGYMTTVVPDNIICALWFIGVFPKDTFQVFKENRFENTKFIYTFDKKSCKLKCKQK